MWTNINTGVLVTSAFASIMATILVLLTRQAFYRIRDLFPARALFKGIAGSEAPCRVFIIRMTDQQQSGRYLTPVPRYAVATSQRQFEGRQHTPWVTSTAETQSVAHILNVLGRAGRTDNIELAFTDEDFDEWDVPMIILGGSWKATRAFATCNPIFRFSDDAFHLDATGQSFRPRTDDHDLGLLQKMKNPSTRLPVWIAMGWRGAGTNAATGALSRWWRELGTLYGSRPFGLLVEMNDRDGWQQFRILRLHPVPRWYTMILHPLAWRTIRRAMITEVPEQQEEEGTEQADEQVSSEPLPSTSSERRGS